MELVRDQRLEEIALKVVADKPEAAYLFSPEMFSSPQHAIIFDKVTKAHAESKKVDRNLLVSYLNLDDRLKQVGEKTLDSIFAHQYGDDFISDYAEQLKQLAILRKAQIDLFTLADKASKSNVPAIISGIESIKTEIYSKAEVSQEDTSISALVDRESEFIFSDTPKKDLIPTGFSEFDALMGGFELGDLVILAARPSMGKTSLLIRWMLNMAKQGHVVELDSYEMTNSQVVKRFLSMESGLPTNRLQQNLLSPEERTNLKKVINELKPLSFTFRYKVGKKIAELANHIRLAKQANGIEVFGIDYVQQMDLTPGMETQELGRISKALKGLAVELGIVILLVSQLNRNVEQRKDKHPMLSDLRQSGELEEDADKIIFPYREYYYSKDPSDMYIAEINVAKNRNGPLGSFNIMFSEETTNFYEL